MTIDSTELPTGSVVEYHDADRLNIRSVYVVDGGFAHYRGPMGFGPTLRFDEGEVVTRVFVPVPEGMTVQDAQQALTEHVAWVPLPRERWKDIHAGARVRIVAASGDVHLVTAARQDDHYIVTDDYLYGGAETESVFSHPDDVTTDPDAELIEAMAKVVLDNFHGPDDNHPTWHLNPVTVARAALAVVREREATR